MSSSVAGRIVRASLLFVCCHCCRVACFWLLRACCCCCCCTLEFFGMLPIYICCRLCHAVCIFCMVAPAPLPPMVACVAMLCILCAALLAAALICVAKLAAGSGELGCCNGTCASAAISCTASVAMCCRYIGVFAVAPLHSSVYCGAATASAATAFPLLISAISSAAAVRDCRWHCALARYTFSALCARALAVDRRTPSSSKTPTPSSMVSSWLASASATARVYLCSASASRDAAASALPADGSVSCKAAVVARWRGAPSGAFAAGGGALPPWAASLATRDRSPTCVESGGPVVLGADRALP